MLSDPWSRPTLEDLRRVDESQIPASRSIPSDASRFPCCIPAELITSRGNSISAMTREIGPSGLALVHKGSVPLGAARLRLASERDELVYWAHVETCVPCMGGLFHSEVAITSEDVHSTGEPSR